MVLVLLDALDTESHWVFSIVLIHDLINNLLNLKKDSLFSKEYITTNLIK